MRNELANLYESIQPDECLKGALRPPPARNHRRKAAHIYIRIHTHSYTPTLLKPPSPLHKVVLPPLPWSSLEFGLRLTAFRLRAEDSLLFIRIAN